ncbi:MAG: hypothetical protein OER88_07725 [Planctomycetota bacterium]|nr:hypothetical protein [Planctomycetota bacterium]
MVEAAPVLALDEVAVRGPDYDIGLWNVSLELHAGELALVLLDDAHRRFPLADVAQGLVAPEHGVVRFAGVDWCAMRPRRAAQRRAAIGRVFGEEAWLPSMATDENILVAQLHHTRRRLRDLEDEACELAQDFGLPGLPRSMPGRMLPPDLQRAALARAFLGECELLVLERPTKDIFPDVMPALVSKIRAARRAGAAVLWMTSRLAVWNDRALRPDRRFRVAGSRILPVEEEV